MNTPPMGCAASADSLCIEQLTQPLLRRLLQSSIGLTPTTNSLLVAMAEKLRVVDSLLPVKD